MTRAALSAQPGAALLGQNWPLRNDVYEVSVSRSAFILFGHTFVNKALFILRFFSESILLFPHLDENHQC